MASLGTKTYIYETVQILEDILESIRDTVKEKDVEAGKDILAAAEMVKDLSRSLVNGVAARYLKEQTPTGNRPGIYEAKDLKKGDQTRTFRVLADPETIDGNEVLISIRNTDGSHSKMRTSSFQMYEVVES